MYLLQEDEGNEEEILRLLSTSGHPLTPPTGPTQVLSTHMTHTPPTSNDRTLCDGASAVPTSCRHPVAPPTTSAGYNLQNYWFSTERSSLSCDGREKGRDAWQTGRAQDGTAVDCRANTSGEAHVNSSREEKIESPVVAVSREPLASERTVTSRQAGSTEYQDILAKATSIIPLSFHQLVNEPSQVSGSTEAQSSSLLSSLLLEISKLDRGMGAITGARISGTEVSRSTTGGPPPLDGASHPYMTASVTCETSTSNMPRSSYGNIHLRTDPSTAKTSTVGSRSSMRHSSGLSAHRVQQQASHAHMVNEGTQTSREVSPRQTYTAGSSPGQSSVAASRIGSRKLSNASPERQAASQQRNPQSGQRAARAQSVPVVQPSPHSSSSSISSASQGLPNAPQLPPSPSSLTPCGGLNPVASTPPLKSPANSNILSLERRVSVTSSALQALDALSSVLKNSITATQQHREPLPSTDKQNKQMSIASTLGEPSAPTGSYPNQSSAVQHTPPLFVSSATCEARTSIDMPTSASRFPSVVSGSSEVSLCVPAIQPTHSVLTSQERGLPLHNQRTLEPSLQAEGTSSGHPPARTVVLQDSNNYLEVGSELESVTEGVRSEGSSPTVVELPNAVSILQGGDAMVQGGESGEQRDGAAVAASQQLTCTLSDSPVEADQDKVLHDDVSSSSSVQRTQARPSPVMANPITTSAISSGDTGLITSPGCSLATTGNSNPEMVSRDDHTNRASKVDSGFNGHNQEGESVAKAMTQVGNSHRQEATAGGDQGLPLIHLQSRASSISLCFPVVGWDGKTIPGPVVGVSAMPVELLPPPTHSGVKTNHQNGSKTEGGRSAPQKV